MPYETPAAMTAGARPVRGRFVFDRVPVTCMEHRAATIVAFWLTLVVSGFAIARADGPAPSKDRFAGKVPVCFRCDDVRALGDGDGPEVLDTYRAIVETFQRRRVPLTLGVIPDYRGVTKLVWNGSVAHFLRQAAKDADVELALHGHTHEPVDGVSEWLGVPYEKQREKLAEALSIMYGALGDRSFRTFLPPWNSFDLNTVRAIRERGFECLSGDLGIVRKAPFAIWTSTEHCYFGVRLVPATCSLRECDEALRLAKRDGDGTLLVVIFHPYDFREFSKHASRGNAKLEISDLEAIVGRFASDRDVVCTRLRDLPGNLLTEERYTAACEYYVLLYSAEKVIPKRWLVSAGLIDASVGRWLPLGRYLSADRYNRLALKCLIGVAGSIGVLGGVAAYAVGRLLRKRHCATVISWVFWATWVLVLAGLEYYLQLVTSPATRGLLVLYCLVGPACYIVILTACRNRATHPTIR